MIFEPTEDVAVIRPIITHPQIYPASSDDGSPKPEEWTPDFSKCFFILVKDGEEVLGMFVFEPINCATVKVHTCLLPNAWGVKAHTASLLMSQWIFAKTKFERIITDVPEYNRLALRFARQAGMRQFGLNPKSFRKGGKLYDQIELGMSK